MIVSQGTLSATNYSFSFTDGSLTVTKATLTVIAENKSRVYGATNPQLTASYSGFVNGDTAAALGGSPSLSTAAGASSTVAGSPYPITAALGTLNAANYDFAFADGALTITPASALNSVTSSANPSCTG